MSKPDTHRPPCVGYSLSQSTGSASCAIHGYLPLICPCGDYSPDYGALGQRVERWNELMSLLGEHDLGDRNARKSG